MPATQLTTVSEAEVARFDALALQWWNPAGPMRPLHQMNPVRVAWITARIGPGQRILDIGCGAGLLAEALARRGHDVLGLDPAAAAIAAARQHAARSGGLSLAYRVGEVEDLIAEGAGFPVVTALELIEHVPEPDVLLARLARVVAPGGRLFISTLNRTALSFLTAKLGAEWVLRWLPVGTHDWRKFVAPAELAAGLRRAGLHLSDIAGLAPDPLRGGWRTTRSLSVNYIAMACRMGEQSVTHHFRATRGDG